MPKQVDNYILERVIGKGQFGEVFKGYSKVDGRDIAVKAIGSLNILERNKVQGKFLELLETEIKVLKQCNNTNIIKLFDLKKTSNNFYLILEYCNEGDFSQYLKTRKKLTEQEAVEYLIQILNGFKSLVKYKILHRDFKLANLMKHNNMVKIADFGFSKILENDNKTNTMLGSPLNMAPEVLNGENYNNKADVWSLGTVFYELLFGKPPFIASNIIDLLKNIKSQKLDLPLKINNISQTCQDVLKQMLTVDPNARISWEDLFNHKINFYQEENLKKELEKSIMTNNLSISMSKFYIKNNVVIDHPSEIDKKKELNHFAIEFAKKKQITENTQQQYNGNYVKRPLQRSEETDEEFNTTNQKEYHPEDEGKVAKHETEREIQIRVYKKNSNRILHERNIYVFLATVAEEAMDLESYKYSQLVGFFLVKKLIQQIEQIKKDLQQKQNHFKLDLWQQYVEQKDFKDIQDYIFKENEVFMVYYDQLLEQLRSNVPKIPELKRNILEEINKNLSESIDVLMQELLRFYIKEILEQFSSSTKQEQMRNLYYHIDKLLDCLDISSVFIFEDKQGNQFNFKTYYDFNNQLSFEELGKKIEKKIDRLLF